MKNKYLTKVEAEKMFKEVFKNYLKTWNTVPTDKPAKREAWNDFCDSLRKNGQIPENSDWCQPRFIRS